MSISVFHKSLLAKKIPCNNFFIFHPFFPQVWELFSDMRMWPCPACSGQSWRRLGGVAPGLWSGYYTSPGRSRGVVPRLWGGNCRGFWPHELKLLYLIKLVKMMRLFRPTYWLKIQWRGWKLIKMMSLHAQAHLLSQDDREELLLASDDEEVHEDYGEGAWGAGTRHSGKHYFLWLYQIMNEVFVFPRSMYT